MKRPRTSTASAAFLLGLAGVAQSQPTSRCSVSSMGAEGNGPSGVFTDVERIAISADGRHVAFTSLATNLVSGDTNPIWDVFVRDLLAGVTTLVSVDGADLQGNGASGLTQMGISADGRHVAFASDASNLVSGDTNGSSDVFVRDRDSDRNGVFDEPGGCSTVRVSVSSVGVQANGYSALPSISADGRHVAFESLSNNLVPIPSYFNGHIFVRDRDLDGNGVFDEPGGVSTVRISANAFGWPGNSWSFEPSISGDGRSVAFESYATNLAPGDTPWPNLMSILVHDRDADGDGLFDEAGAIMITLVDVDSTGQLANGPSYHPCISADGRTVVFSSDATNLVPGDLNGARDVFVRDLSGGSTTRVSVSSAGGTANGPSDSPAISGDGQHVVFSSWANNLVPGDSINFTDIFLHDRQSGMTTLGSAAAAVGGNGDSSYPAISADGYFIAYSSYASNLVPADLNGVTDVFAVDVSHFHLTSVVPASGSEAGDDLVRIFGEGFIDGPDTSVSFGGAVAALLEVRSDRITARTPAGTGAADMTVTTARGSSTLPSAYTYFERHLAARRGNVNVGLGNRENVLLVNAYPGDSVRREVSLAVNQPMVIVMARPSSRTTISRFVLYASLRDPGPSDVTSLPRGLGDMIFSPPFLEGSPVAIWNNVGHSAILGRATLPSSPAPSVVFRRNSGAPRPVVVALQGLIEDDGSQIPARWSVTNGVVLRVQ